jgi:hypothetical protein
MIKNRIHLLIDLSRRSAQARQWNDLLGQAGLAWLQAVELSGSKTRAKSVGTVETGVTGVLGRPSVHGPNRFGMDEQERPGDVGPVTLWRSRFAPRTWS